MKSQKVILLLGGNDPDTLWIIEKALLLIQKETGRLLRVSSFYKTAAWGPVPQPDFINIAVAMHSLLPPVYLLKKILSIETRLGRRRTIKYGPRTIDIDLLFYGNTILHHKDLIVPHPQLQNRRFVLLPCNEIIPGFVHPQLKKTIHQLLIECKDNLEVRKWSN